MPAYGRMFAACSAIHGECSKTLARTATKSSLLQPLSSESIFDIDLSDVEGVLGEMFQIGVPVIGDLKPRRHPDPLMLHDVIEKAHQRRGAAGTADQPAMKADRHHLRRGLALGIEHVKTVLQVGEELVAAAEPLRVHKAH